MATITFLGITLSADTSAAKAELHRRSVEREARALIQQEIRREEIAAAKERMKQQAALRSAEVEALFAAMKAEREASTSTSAAKPAAPPAPAP